MRISVKYLKSIAAGAAASAVTVIVFSIFRLQRHDLAWGSFYALDFPGWPIVIVSLLAFAIAFARMLRRART